MVHNLEKFSSNPDKLHFGGLVHFLRYIRNKNNLRLKYYAKIQDEPIYDLLRQDIINTENQLMVLSDYIWQNCPDNCRSTGEYILFYQGWTIDYCIHVTCPVSQSSSESNYNAACTKLMPLAHYRMLNIELLNKYPDLVP